MKRIFSLIAFLLLIGSAQAQVPQGGIAIHGRGQTATGDAISVRCRDITDTSFEACGGVGGSGGDGAINDGVSSSIKATVFDRTNSNPLATQLVDSNGDPVSVGGGTQYGQGSAATDTDQLMMAGCVRADTAAVATGVADGDRARCIVDATGRMWVHVGTIDGGTITSITNPVAVTQSGSWTNVGVTGPLTDAQLRATPVPISGTVTVTDGSGALNVIVDSSALPTGAATAANQDGIIRDGTGDTTQANVSSGRLHVDGSGVTQPVSGTVNIGTFPDNEPFNMAQVSGTAVSVGNGVAGTGVQRVAIASDNTAFTVNIGTFPDNEPINVAQMNGVAVTMGNGISGTGVQRVTIASDSTGVVGLATGSNTIGNVNPGTAANWGVYVEDAGETAGGNLSMAGAVRRDTLASSSGTSGDNSTINTTADGALWVAPVAATNGGTSISRTVSAASTNATNVKASAGQVYAIIASNVNASARYLHLYNTAGTPTCNASIVATFVIPGNTAGAGNNIPIPPGAAFGTGIGLCLTTAIDGTGSVSANEHAINVFYR